MRLGAVALVVGLALDLGTGCGTSPSAGTGAIGKQGGAGGQGGGTDGAVAPDGGAADGAAGGASGNGISGNTGYQNLPGGEMPSCAVIATQYTDTIATAQTCDPGAGGQCQQLVPSSLSPCPVCMTYVNTSIALLTIKADWDQLGCGASSGGCQPPTCTQPAGATCSAASGGASCVSN